MHIFGNLRQYPGKVQFIWIIENLQNIFQKFFPGSFGNFQDRIKVFIKLCYTKFKLRFFILNLNVNDVKNINYVELNVNFSILIHMFHIQL